MENEINNPFHNGNLCAKLSRGSHVPMHMHPLMIRIFNFFWDPTNFD